MIAYAVVPAWGRHWAYLAVVLYFINVLIALIINIGMLFIIFSRQTHTHESFGSTLLLPVITAVVVASTGGVVGEPMLAYDPWLARACVLVAYIIWGTGTPTAFLIVGSWIHRSMLFGYPPPAAIVSVFLPLGPFGQASFGVVVLGRVLRATVHAGVPIAPILDLQTNLVLAEAIYAVSLVVSLIIWGFAAVWYVLGTAICIDYHFNRSNRAFFSRSSFALNYWGLTFPIGVFATGATELAGQLDSGILRVIGTILSLQVVLHCIWISWMTVWKAWDGSIFAAPEVLAMDGAVKRRWAPTVQDSTVKASA
jgi:tellurite resistance protein TehA-like permease